MLVAIPVVVVMLRLYPLAVRGLLAVSARGAGATGFVALSRAARSSLTGVLPAFALVLALSLATFAGMVSHGVTRGEVAASWQTTGADVLIQGGPYSPPVTPAAVHAIAAVPGVRQATAVWNTSWVTSYGQVIAVTAVEPRSYAAVVAGTPFPAFPAAKIGTGPAGRYPPIPRCRCSPRRPRPRSSAAAPTAGLAVPDGAVHGAGRGHPEQHPRAAGGGAFIVMPLETVPGATASPRPT